MGRGRSAPPAPPATFAKISISTTTSSTTCPQAALKVDRPASGSFPRQYHRQRRARRTAYPLQSSPRTPFPSATTDARPEAAGRRLLRASDSPSTAVERCGARTRDGRPAIVAVHDSLKISSDTGAPITAISSKTTARPTGPCCFAASATSAVDKHGLTLTGKYGVIHVDSDGDYTYTVDAAKLAGLSGNVSESFQYKISDGASHIDTDSLSIAINVDAFHSSHLLV